MAKFPTWMPVVALALFDGQGRVLLQQRPPGKAHAGQWEFPGGKVEMTENPRQALCREIAEELAITVDPQSLRPALVTDEGPDRPIVLFLYTAHAWKGDIRGLEGQQWSWFALAEAAALPLPPMDRDLLERLGG